MTSLLNLFCDVDYFWQRFQPHWEQDLLQGGSSQRRRSGQLSVSEVMTIMIHLATRRGRLPVVLDDG